MHIQKHSIIAKIHVQAKATEHNINFDQIKISVDDLHDLLY